MNRGAIVLCGGKSTRMGTAKALLPFGPELMLQRVVRLVGEVVAMENMVVVAADRQELPSLPKGVTVVHDAREGRGPLEGLAAGLQTLSDRVKAVYATSCDVPLIKPALVNHMFELLGEHDIVVPRDGKFHHPLAAVYRLSVLDHVQHLLAAERLRPFYLFEQANTREVPVDQLRGIDPELQTLENLNTPEEYLKALQDAGYPKPI